MEREEEGRREQGKSRVERGREGGLHTDRGSANL